MKKIGVLTYFWSANPGTFLQAYSTCMAINKYFTDAEVELINCRTADLKLKFGKSSINPKNFIQEIKRFLTYRNFQKQILPLSHKQLKTNDTDAAIDFINSQNYDMIAVGADTILKLNSVNKQNDTIPYYWLSDKISAKKILCAASAGTLTIDQLTQNQQALCEKAINSFDLLAVRDHATYALIESLWKGSHEKLLMVPDPTFTFEIDHGYAEKYITRKGLDLSKPIFALNTLKSFKYASCLADHYRKKGYQVVSLMSSNVADSLLFDLSPFEWAGLYKYIDVLVTDRFHGTLFCLKNQTPVIGVLCDKRKTNAFGRSKVHSLLDSFGLADTNFLNCFEVHDESQVIDFVEKGRSHFKMVDVLPGLKKFRDEYVNIIQIMNDL